MRIGSTNRVASVQWISSFNQERSPSSFDQEPCIGTSEKDLNMQEIHLCFRETSKKIDRHKLITLGILTPYGQKTIPSKGGIILFRKEHIRQNYFPQTTIRCARFLGKDKTDFLDQSDMSKSILGSMEDVFTFIRRNTRMASKIEKIQREDIAEYSPIIIREVLTNTLVHADYSIQGMNP